MVYDTASRECPSSVLAPVPCVFRFNNGAVDASPFPTLFTSYPTHRHDARGRRIGAGRVAGPVGFPVY